MAEVAVIGAVVGVGIRLVLDNLLPLPIEEIKQVWGFEKELKKLQKSLEMIKAFMLDADVEQSDRHAVKLWLKRLEDVAFEADAVLDDFNYQLLRQKVENHDQGIKKVTCCFFLCPNNLLFQRKMSRKIKSVCDNLEAVNSEANSFGLQTMSHGVHHASPSGLAYQTDSYAIEPNVIGRHNDVSTIVKMLVTASMEISVSVIPIVGMGGLGKTAVAREVFHDEEIKSHFGVKIWVYVSVGFNDFTLFKMILQSLTKENVEVILTKEVVLNKLRQVLDGERYLLVLDDIWNDELYKWEGFVNSLIGISPQKGNGIIVTTRLEKVASIVKGISTHRLSRLSQDECWSIIKTKALSRAVVPQEFEEIGKSIAEKCHGLPLAAKIVGGMLYGKSKDDWHSMLKNQFSYLGRDDIRILEILKLSYDNLPSSSLKKCFMYCCVFPQNHLIEREQLIELWAAEGFLQAADEENDMETVGNNFFNDLLQYSLFQDPHKDDYGNITNCRMHDLVHDVACSISGNRSININSRGSNYSHRIRYLGLRSDIIGHQDISSEQAKHIRTLFFNGTVAHNMFKRFKCLHVLKLTSFEINELPHAIGKIVQLRFLDISGTQIEELPDSIGKLYKLQTLRICGSRIGLKELPSTTVKLISLRHLHISVVVQLPPGIGKLTSLQTLRVYRVGVQKGCGICELGQLKYLRGELEIKNLERVCGIADAKLADLSAKSNIFKLVFVWNESGNGENNKDVLEGLHPHPNLKSLEIRGYRGENFPLWTMQMKTGNMIQNCWARLDYLMEIKLIQCDKSEEIPMLGHLPSLRFLELMSMDNISSIGLPFYSIENCSTDACPFPALEEIVLSRMPNLTQWHEADIATCVFPCLKRLKIQSCPKLNGTPSHFPCLEEIIITDVGHDFSLENVCSSNLSTLQKLIIKSCPGLIHLPDWLFVMNKNLSSLELLNCPKLTHLVRCMKGVGASLRKLIVMDCEKLKGLSMSNDVETFHPLDELSTEKKGFTSLERLVIHGCEGFTDTPIEVLDSCTSSLKELSFRFLDNFVDLSGIVPYLPRMSCIDNLEVYNLSKLVDLPTTNISSISSNLRRLEIGGYSKRLSIVSFNQFLHCIFHGNPPLKCLTLYGHEDWESLPDKIQNLTALERLDLKNFGIEGLPEWLGNLSSLNLLELRNCRRLRHMPPREAMKRLTKLQNIYILGCPLLAERCKNRGGDSEWPNISHIEKIIIHDHI